MESQELVKLCTDSGAIYALSTFTKDANVRLQLLDKDSAFSCDISLSDLESHGKKINVENLVEWARQAFTVTAQIESTISSSTPLFRFKLSNNFLHWSKFENDRSSMKIALGKFPLKEANFQETLDEILEATINQTKTLTLRNKALSESNEKLMDEVKVGRMELKKFAEEKNNLEQSLYSKFLPILHTKQKKIKELTVALESTGCGGEKSKQARDIRDKDTDSFGSTTDDDINEEQQSVGYHNDSQNILNI